VASVFEEAWAPQYTYIGIIIDTDAIQKLQVRPYRAILVKKFLYIFQLELTIDDIKWAIVAAKKLKIKQEVCMTNVTI